MYIAQLEHGIDPDLVLSDSDIRRLFSGGTLEAGRIYELRGRVQNLQVTQRGASITAQTQGTAAYPYVQRITVRHSARGDLVIGGVCSCPVGRMCKHIAAVLVAARRQQHEDAVSARSRSEGAGPERAGPERAGPEGAGSQGAGSQGAGLQGARLQGAGPQASHADRPRPGTRPSAPAARPGSHLARPVELWLDSLRDDGQDEPDDDSEAYPPAIINRVLYILRPEPRPQAVAALELTAFSGRARKNGPPKQAGQFQLNQLHNPPKYLRPSDRLILPRLQRRQHAYSLPLDDDPADTLRKVLATGRAYWLSAEGPVLREAAARPGAMAWIMQPDGSQRATIEVGEGVIPLLYGSPWYVDPAAGLLGPVTLDMPRSVVTKLLTAPPIPAELAQRVRAELVRRLPRVQVPAPRELPPPKRLEGPVAPRLRLINGTLPKDPGYGRGSARPAGNGLFAVPVARLSYDYGPITIPHELRPQQNLIARDGVLYEPVRDRTSEAAALSRLGELGFGRVSELVPTYYQHAHTNDFALLEGQAGADWLDVVIDEVPRLRAAGWTVEIDDDFPIQVVTSDGELDVQLEEGSGIDWLELHLGVMVDGERVDLVPALLRMLRRPGEIQLEGDKPLVLPLADGRRLALPMDRVRPTLMALMELFAGGGIEPDDGKITFSRLDAPEVARLEEATGIVWKGGEALRLLGRQLREAGGSIPTAAVPPSFIGALRPYQQDGVNWLQFLRGAELGGVLADDMGLGKTVQTLAHLLIDQAEGRLDRPALIVCPTSLIPNWMAEAERFAPGLKVLALHGPARKEHFGSLGQYDLVLSTYPLLSRDHAVLVEQDWHAVILDEAQMIKNPNAETTRQVLRLKAHQRLCLSGTPLQNHLGELWSLFDFLSPGFLGSQKSFASRYRRPIEKLGDTVRQDQLNRRVRPFLLRRTKEEVATELPPKTEITESVELESGQRAIYEGIRLAMHAKVQAAISQKGLARSGIIILDALLKMRQACCDPRLLKLMTVKKTKAGSAKLDRLMELLDVLLPEGRRVLLFSQFTEMLALIEKRLAEDGVEYVMLTGDTKDRRTPVKRFQAGEVPLFLISLKAGGVGLNLTAADTVIHYDPWWNPAAEDQATDRAHRIGQTKKVFVHRLVTMNTIEQKMEVLKEKKRALVASVLEAEHGGALKLTEADVEALFAPGD
jgi:superfamily II DNA or RNA helicase